VCPQRRHACRLTTTCGVGCGWGLSAAIYHSEFRDVLGYPYFNVSTSEDLAYHTEYGSVYRAVRVMRQRRLCLPHRPVYAFARSRLGRHSGLNCSLQVRLTSDITLRARPGTDSIELDVTNGRTVLYVGTCRAPQHCG
jgi:hypothetical protein